MKIKAVELRGRTVTSSDGKARWATNGDEHEVPDAVGAKLLNACPGGMFTVVSSEKPAASAKEEVDAPKSNVVASKTKKRSMQPTV